MSTHDESWNALPHDAIEKLKQSLDPKIAARMSPTGDARNEVSYMEAHIIIDQANRIFGYGNWGYELLREDQDTDESGAGNYYAWVRVSVKGCLPVVEIGDCSLRVGYGKSANAAQKSMARKGAVTDGMKRGLRHFGDQFGNSLYDKDSDIHKAIAAAAESEQRATAAQSQRRGDSDRGSGSGRPAPTAAQKPTAASSAPSTGQSRTASTPASSGGGKPSAPSATEAARSQLPTVDQLELGKVKNIVLAEAVEAGFGLKDAKWAKWHEVARTVNYAGLPADPKTVTVEQLRGFYKALHGYNQGRAATVETATPTTATTTTAEPPVGPTATREQNELAIEFLSEEPATNERMAVLRKAATLAAQEGKLTDNQHAQIMAYYARVAERRQQGASS